MAGGSSMTSAISGSGHALVHHPQGLVVQVAVDVPLDAQVSHHLLVAPRRPVVGREQDVAAVTEPDDGLGEVLRPDMGVAYHRAAQGEQVVQGVGGVLGHAEGPVPGDVQVHLARGLGAGGHLELDLDAVEGVGLSSCGHQECRDDDARLPGGGALSQTCADLTLRAAGQGCAVHVGGPTRHRGAGVHVLCDRVLQESVRGDDLHPAGVDLLLGHHAEDAAEVVDVAVCVDDGDDRAVTAMLAIQGQRSGGGLRGQQGVDHDHTAVALDEGDHREVETSHLVEALHDLEQAVLRYQLPLAPQARVSRRRRITGQEVERRGVPDDLTRSVANGRILQRGDESPSGFVEVFDVRERQRLQCCGVRRLDRRGGFPLIHQSPPVRRSGSLARWHE